MVEGSGMSYGVSGAGISASSQHSCFEFLSIDTLSF